MKENGMSLLDAFIALEDLEDEEIKKPIKEGKGFRVRNTQEMEKAKEFIEEDTAKDVPLQVIDPDADSLEHLKDNKDYIGQMLLTCDSCGSTRFIDGEELVETDRISEKTKTPIYNPDLECLHCHQVGSGYTLHGQVAAIETPKSEVEPTIENDSLTDEVKFDNDFGAEQPTEETEEAPVEEPKEEETETPTEEAPAEEEEEENEPDNYDEPLSLVEPEEEEEDKEKAKKESLEEDFEIKAESLSDFFDSIVEPENTDELVIYDLDSDDYEEEIYNGSFEDLPESFLDSEFISFNVGQGTLIINIDSESEIDELTPTVKDVLDPFNDEFNTNISVWDQATGDEVFVGTKQSVLEEFGHTAFLSFEAPERLEVILRGVEVKESLKTPYKEELDLADPEDKLIADIIRENRLKEYKIDNYGSDEYWIADSIRNLEDLDYIWENYISGKADYLVNEFKDVTGYGLSEALVEATGDDENLAHKEAEELLKQNPNADAVVYGYILNGKFKRVEGELLVVKGQRELDFATQLVDAKYKPTGSVRVLYRKNVVEAVDYKNRAELTEAILACKENNIPYTVRRSAKEGYRYTLLKENRKLNEDENESVHVSFNVKRFCSNENEYIELINKIKDISGIKSNDSWDDEKEVWIEFDATKDELRKISDATGIAIDFLNKMIDESLDEAKKDDGLPADPEAVKTEVHNTLNTLVKDEIEAIAGYEEAKAEIADTHIEHKDEIIDTLDHIEDEEKEHVDELNVATTEIPFDKEDKEDKEEKEEIIPEEEPIEDKEEFALAVPEEEVVEEAVCPKCGKHPCECLHEDKEPIYVVIGENADSSEIVFEGTYDECEDYIERVEAEEAAEFGEDNPDTFEYFIELKESVNKEVEFDEKKFENFINEWFDKNVEDTAIFESKQGGIKEDGSILIEGKLHLEENKEQDITFVLKPNTLVTEGLKDKDLIFENYKVNITEEKLNESPFLWFNLFFDAPTKEECQAFIDKYIKDEAECTTPSSREITENPHPDKKGYCVIFNTFDLKPETAKEAIELSKASTDVE